MRFAVFADDAGSVDREHHRKLLERRFDKQLIVRALKESRVNRENGLQPARRESAAEGNGVLLRDPDVKKSVGVFLSELV